jgi:hypothetical protein
VEHLRETWGFSTLINTYKGASMRQFIMIGIALLGFGAFVLLRGASFTSRHDVLKVGDVKVTADEQQSIPPWVGGAALVVGAILIVAGARKRA